MVNVEQQNDKLIISYINSIGNIELINIDLPESEKYNWVLSKNKTKYETWNKKFVKKQKSKTLDRFRIIEILQNQPKDIKNKIFSQNLPKIYFIDIETEIKDEFPDINNPQSEIYCITIVNEKNQILTLSTKNLENNQILKIKENINNYFKDFGTFTFKYIHYNDEYTMLTNFIYEYASKMPCMTGWNFLDFDWSYIVSRAKMYKINIEKCSLTEKLKSIKCIKNKIIVPYHKVMIDYMTLYKNWDNSIVDNDSDSLEYISNKILGISKLKYNGSLQDLYENDFEKFILYNIIDATLVKLIHEKINLIEPYFIIVNFTQVEYEKVNSQVFIIENLLIKEYLKNGKYVIQDSDINEKNTYLGGLNLPVKKGFSEWILNFDYISLHPTTMIQFNISPETFIDKNKNNNNIILDKAIKMSSGTLFDSNKGILPTVLSKIYSKRIYYKEIETQIDTEILNLKKILRYK